ncbi:glycosyltransferase family 4 protein [Phytohabitans suffuscus]
MTTEARYARTPDGRVWTVAGPGHSFWRRYLAVFEEVRVVARVEDAPTAPGGAERVDGAGVHVWPLPHYLGPRGYLGHWPAVRRQARGAARDGDAVVVRLPSPVGELVAARLERSRRPYAVEAVGDPYDVLAPGVVRHPLRPLIRLWSARRMRQACWHAPAVSYVTERALQARYPPHPGAAAAHYSSIELPTAAFVTRPRRPTESPDSPTLVSVGSLDQLYKGIDTLVTAIAGSRTGPAPRLVHVGGGRHLPRIEALVRRLGVADRVRLTGAVPAGSVRGYLDAADVFVLPSRTEGLPRALIEAMARGLPSIGTRVGGVPELLAPEDLVPPDDPPRLAEAIHQLLVEPARMAAASARNLARARAYRAEELTPRRTGFYRTLRAMTEDGHRWSST